MAFNQQDLDEITNDDIGEGPFSTRLCTCKYIAKDGHWVVQNRHGHPLTRGWSKHKRVADAHVEELNLKYAQHIMVQP